MGDLLSQSRDLNSNASKKTKSNFSYFVEEQNESRSLKAPSADYHLTVENNSYGNPSTTNKDMRTTFIDSMIKRERQGSIEHALEQSDLAFYLISKNYLIIEEKDRNND